MQKNHQLTVVSAGRGKGNMLVISRDDALNVAAQNEAERKVRRQGRTVYRLRRHLTPWWAALAVLPLTGLLWGVGSMSSTGTAVSIAALLSAVLGVVGWLLGRQAGQWRRRVWVGTGAASVWLPYAVLTGPSWDAALALVLIVCTLSARYWQAIRIPHPLAPADPEEEKDPKDGPVHQRWKLYAACQGGTLPGSWLTGRDTSDPGGRERYDLHLFPGRQTHSLALANLDKVSSALNLPMRNFVLEPHPNELPTMMRLTVMKKSPIQATVKYTGPKVGGGIIQIGPYGDGDGTASWRYWTPGEVPNAGSWWGGAIIAGMGSGKSRLMELLATGLLSTGHAVVWFIDPQGGASSPSLKKAADWFVDLDGAEKMLDALERITKWRGKEMDDEGWIGFDPTPERPGITVFIDEAHEVFLDKALAQRWTTLARKIRKVGISLVILSQYPGLKTFGMQEPLRAAVLAGNLVAMSIEANGQKQLMPGLDIDPGTLPKDPGFGFTVRRGGKFGRTAPFRAEYVEHPDEWLGMFPSPTLDPLATNSAGQGYLDRHKDMAAALVTVRAEIEAMRAGRAVASAIVTRAIEQESTGEELGDGFLVPAFPGRLQLVKPEAEPPAPANGREAILAVLAQGDAKTGELQKAAGVGETRIRQLIGEMVKAEKIKKVGHGLYRLIDSAEA